MAENTLSFDDYLGGGVHCEFKQGSDARTWARKRLALIKELKGLDHGGEAWVRDFAASVSFTGAQDDFVDRIVGYMLLEDVTLDMGTRAFRKPAPPSSAPQQPPHVDPSILKLLEDQGKLIESLASKVQGITEAPAKEQLRIPDLSLKALHEINAATNHPQWINRALFLLASFLKFETPQLAALVMIPKMTDEAMKAIHLCLSDAHKQDDTTWQNRKPAGDDVNMEASDPDHLQRRLQCLVEGLWSLVYSSANTYKRRYEGKSGTSSTSGPQSGDDIRLEPGLSEAGMRLKKVMRRRFKYIDGAEPFEIQKGEWVNTTEDPVGPCKTCRAKGEVVRHWIWRCPFLE